jgi:ParB/RepB/Spo0J family partition protein
MSMKFNTAVKPEKGNEYLLDLADIAVDHGSNNRFSQSDVKTLVQSISQYGQLEAVGAVRVKPTNTLRLAYGFGRYEAIRQINEGLLEDQRMKIKVVVFDGNERDVFFRNLAENAHRNELSHMDYAFAIRRMKENFGQNDKQIANFFNRTVLWVADHKVLLSLDYTIQNKVHNREINITDALTIAKMAPEKQKEIVEEVKKVEAEVEPITTDSTVAAEAAEPVIEAATEPVPAPAKEKATKKKIKEVIQKAAAGTNQKAKRSWGELHGFFEVMIGSPAVSDELQKLAAVMIAIMKGELNDDSEAVEALEALIAGSKQ